MGLSVAVVGVHGRTTPIGVLEAIAVPADLTEKALGELQHHSRLREVVVVSTCLRTEIYAVVPEFHPAVAELRDFMATWSGLPPEVVSDQIFSYFGRSAAEHLFSVAAGLDSAVLGEGEILAQVRQAVERAREAGTVGPVLADLFRHAIQVGKRVRSETTIGEGGRSMASAAVAAIGSEVGGLDGRASVVVGSGVVGLGLVRNLERRGARVSVVSRDPARATLRLAGTSARAVGPQAAPDVLAEAAVVALATRGGLPFDPAALIDAPELRCVVDLSLPRVLEPTAAARLRCSVLDVEAVAAAARARRARQAEEVRPAYEIVAEELELFGRRRNGRQAARTVAQLRARAESLRREELARYARRLQALEPEEREAVERLTSALVAKLCHQPSVALREAASREDGGRLDDAARELFGL